MAASDDLDKIDKQISQLKARKSQIKARQRKQERAKDAQRKIVIGATLMRHAELHPEWQDVIWKILNEHVQRPYDRELLGLEPLPEKADTPT